MTPSPVPQGAVLVDTAAAAAAVGRKPADLRRWAQRGLLRPVHTPAHPDPHPDITGPLPPGHDPRSSVWLLTEVLAVADAHPPQKTGAHA